MAEINQRLAADPALREAYCVVLDGDGWHKGVVGICASRVVERCGRPALVIAREGEQAQGSGRSIEAFHLLDALESCADLFSRFGGHAHAAGFALPCSRIEELRTRMNAWARARLTPADFEPVLCYDTVLDLEQVTAKLFDSVQRLAPFGMGNPEPVFVAPHLRVVAPPRVMKEHIKLRLAQDASGGEERSFSLPTARRTFAALGWRMAERVQREGIAAGDLLDVAFKLEHNPHPEFGGLELNICDFARPGERAKSMSESA
jgi:single-stranded-DNA-specific exonuclease